MFSAKEPAFTAAEIAKKQIVNNKLVVYCDNPIHHYHNNYIFENRQNIFLRVEYIYIQKEQHLRKTSERTVLVLFVVPRVAITLSS